MLDGTLCKEYYKSEIETVIGVYEAEKQAFRIEVNLECHGLVFQLKII